MLTCSKRAGGAATPRARGYGQRGSEMISNRSMFSIWPRQSAAAAGAGLLLLVISVWGVHVLYRQGSSAGLAVRQTASEDALPARLHPVYQVA